MNGETMFAGEKPNLTFPECVKKALPFASRGNNKCVERKRAYRGGVAAPSNAGTHRVLSSISFFSKNVCFSRKRLVFSCWNDKVKTAPEKAAAF